MMTLNELIRELHEIRSQTEDYDMGALPVEIQFEGSLPDADSVECMNDSQGRPYYVRINAS